MWIILAPAFLWLALMLTGIDRFTTPSANAPLSWFIIVGWSAAVFGIAFRAHLTNESLPDKIEKLKRDSKPAWIAAGILMSTLLAGLSGIVANRLVKTAAQYLSGSTYPLAGEVTSVRFTTSRTTCNSYATVSGIPAGQQIRVCLKVTPRSPIGPLDLEPGQRVTLDLKDTVLGTVVLGIRRN
jgi:hypothetical protein